MVEVLSIIIALSSTREDVTAPCGRPWMWFGGVILQERVRYNRPASLA